MRPGSLFGSPAARKLAPEVRQLPDLACWQVPDSGNRTTYSEGTHQEEKQKEKKLLEADPRLSRQGVAMSKPKVFLKHSRTVFLKKTSLVTFSVLLWRNLSENVRKEQKAPFAQKESNKLCGNRLVSWVRLSPNGVLWEVPSNTRQPGEYGAAGNAETLSFECIKVSGDL